MFVRNIIIVYIEFSYPNLNPSKKTKYVSFFPLYVSRFFWSGIMFDEGFLNEFKMAPVTHISL